MSSLDSQFLCLGTIFSNDIVGHYIGRDRFSDRQMVWIARGFIVAIVVVTWLMSLGEPRSVFVLGIWCFSGFASLFPLVFASLYWKRLTLPGAYASVLVTITLWCFLFYKSGFAEDEYTVDFTLGGQLYKTMPVLWIFLGSLVSLVAVSLVTRPPSEEKLAKFFPPKQTS